MTQLIEGRWLDWRPPRWPLGNRRQLFGWLASGMVVGAGMAVFSRARADGPPAESYGPINLPGGALDLADRMRANAVAAGDQGYGAVVVRDGEVVGLGASRVISTQDPTAHAEMEAIRDAARRVGSRDLSGCVLYSTSPPCQMCESAAYWARIESMLQRTNGDPVSPRYRACG